jgi:hypothetical protein
MKKVPQYMPLEPNALKNIKENKIPSKLLYENISIKYQLILKI